MATLTDDTVERYLDVCLEAVEEEPDRFSAWERDFLESAEDQNEQGFLSEAQVDKLLQIYEDRCS